jgi:hypothetical protein
MRHARENVENHRADRLVTLSERDRLGDSACDATHLVPSVDQQHLDHIGVHQVIFGNQDLEHA